jgi:hypothetical protein
MSLVGDAQADASADMFREKAALAGREEEQPCERVAGIASGANFADVLRENMRHFTANGGPPPLSPLGVSGRQSSTGSFAAGTG